MGVFSVHDVFQAGVEPGGLTADYEIKMLICYILRTLGEPVPVSALIEVFVSEGIGNYFEAASAAAGLVKTGHLTIERQGDERFYQATELANSTADTLARDLPPVVRDKAVAAARHALRLRESRAKNHVDVRKAPDGYLLTMTITDVGSDLLSTTLLVPDKETCTKISERFVEDPILMYKGIVAVLTGSFESVGPLVDSGPEQEGRGPAGAGQNH